MQKYDCIDYEDKFAYHNNYTREVLIDMKGLQGINIEDMGETWIKLKVSAGTILDQHARTYGDDPKNIEKILK